MSDKSLQCRFPSALTPKILSPKHVHRKWDAFSDRWYSRCCCVLKSVALPPSGSFLSQPWVLVWKESLPCLRRHRFVRLEVVFVVSLVLLWHSEPQGIGVGVHLSEHLSELLVSLQLKELYTLLNENYVEDDDNMFRFDYSPEFLLW